MTEVSGTSDTAAKEAPVGAGSPAWTGVWRTIGTLAKRSATNRRQTIAKIAHRRLWRPAAYPRTDWKAWLCYAIAVVAIMAVVVDPAVGSFGRQWPAGLVQFAETVTRIGLSGWYLFPAAAVGILVNLTDWSGMRGRRLLRIYNWTGLSVFVLLSVGIPGLLATVLKHVIGRARPLHFAEYGAYSLHPLTGSASFASLPSGHSCTMGSVAMILILLIPGSRFLVIPLALGIATTRVILFSHYPSDVVAGLALGASFTLMTAIVFARLGYVVYSLAEGLPKRRKSFSVFW